MSATLPAFPTPHVFEQRGNYPTFAVKWEGDNLEDVLTFIKGRGGVDSYWLPPDADQDLIVKRGIHYLCVVKDTWLVGQAVSYTENGLLPWRFVHCHEERFNLLYREVSPEESKTRLEAVKDGS